jgi:hypothetical protein
MGQDCAKMGQDWAEIVQDWAEMGQLSLWSSHMGQG